MLQANLYPSAGQWNLRFGFVTSLKAWTIEFQDPRSGCQTIPVPLKFPNWDFAASLLRRHVLSDLAAHPKRAVVRGVTRSEEVGQLVLDLHFASRLSEADVSPWYYSTYYGPGCAVLQWSDGEFHLESQH